MRTLIGPVLPLRLRSLPPSAHSKQMSSNGLNLIVFDISGFPGFRLHV
jgi:hypothetical protein